MPDELLFKAGLSVAGIAAAAGIAAVILLRAWRKRLEARLDMEYGEKRR
jgi:hypothetical protein